METFTLKSMIDCSRNITTTNQFIEDIVEWIISHPNDKPSCVSSDLVMVFNQE